MTEAPPTTSQRPLIRGLKFAAVVTGGLLVALTWFVFEPLFSGAKTNSPESAIQQLLPKLNDQPWHALAIQDGRTKPFETACGEIVRQITGRTKLEKQNPVAVVLSWMLHDERSNENGAANWEHFPFLLCDHHGLRSEIYRHETATLTPDEEHWRSTGKYISPAALRNSPGFDALLASASKLRMEFQKKAHLKMSREQLKAEEVSRRLMLFDTLCGRGVTRLHDNVIVNEQFVNLAEYAEVKELSREDALAALEKTATGLSDPLHLVGLDGVPGSGWFSLAELRRLQREPVVWREFMDQRLTERPQQYIAPERAQALRDFQKQLEGGKGSQALEPVVAALRTRRDERLKTFDAAYRAGDRPLTNRLLQEIVRTEADRDRFRAAREKIIATQTNEEKIHAASLEQLRKILADADERIVERMQQGVALASRGPYHPDSPEFGPLHLDFLESLFPDLYRESTAAQPYPDEAVSDVLDSFDAAREAFRSGDARQFDTASHNFFTALRTTTDARLPPDVAQRDRLAYPGTSTIPIELLFNRSQPFMWAWLTMFVATALLLASLGTTNRQHHLPGARRKFLQDPDRPLQQRHRHRFCRILRRGSPRRKRRRLQPGQPGARPRHSGLCRQHRCVHRHDHDLVHLRRRSLDQRSLLALHRPCRQHLPLQHLRLLPGHDHLRVHRLPR